MAGVCSCPINKKCRFWPRHKQPPDPQSLQEWDQEFKEVTIAYLDPSTNKVVNLPMLEAARRAGQDFCNLPANQGKNVLTIPVATKLSQHTSMMKKTVDIHSQLRHITDTFYNKLIDALKRIGIPAVVIYDFSLGEYLSYSTKKNKIRGKSQNPAGDKWNMFAEPLSRLEIKIGEKRGIQLPNMETMTDADVKKQLKSWTNELPHCLRNGVLEQVTEEQMRNIYIRHHYNRTLKRQNTSFIYLFILLPSRKKIIALDLHAVTQTGRPNGNLKRKKRMLSERVELFLTFHQDVLTPGWEIVASLGLPCLESAPDFYSYWSSEGELYKPCDNCAPLTIDGSTDLVKWFGDIVGGSNAEEFNYKEDPLYQELFSRVVGFSWLLEIRVNPESSRGELQAERTDMGRTGNTGASSLILPTVCSCKLDLGIHEIHQVSVPVSDMGVHTNIEGTKKRLRPPINDPLERDLEGLRAKFQDCMRKEERNLPIMEILTEQTDRVYLGGEMKSSLISIPPDSVPLTGQVKPGHPGLFDAKAAKSFKAKHSEGSMFDKVRIALTNIRKNVPGFLINNYNTDNYMKFVRSLANEERKSDAKRKKMSFQLVPLNDKEKLISKCYGFDFLDSVYYQNADFSSTDLNRTYDPVEKKIAEEIGQLTMDVLIEKTVILKKRKRYTGLIKEMEANLLFTRKNESLEAQLVEKYRKKFDKKGTPKVESSDQFPEPENKVTQKMNTVKKVDEQLSVETDLKDTVNLYRENRNKLILDRDNKKNLSEYCIYAKKIESASMEVDILLVLPESRLVIEIEIKSTDSSDNESQDCSRVANRVRDGSVQTKNLNDLVAACHQDILSTDWKFVRVIGIPLVNSYSHMVRQFKESSQSFDNGELVNSRFACRNCNQFILDASLIENLEQWFLDLIASRPKSFEINHEYRNLVTRIIGFLSLVDNTTDLSNNFSFDQQQKFDRSHTIRHATTRERNEAAMIGTQSGISSENPVKDSISDDVKALQDNELPPEPGTSISSLKTVIYWNKHQLSLFISQKRNVILNSNFGSGKTLLLKALAKRVAAEESGNREIIFISLGSARSTNYDEFWPEESIIDVSHKLDFEGFSNVRSWSIGDILSGSRYSQLTENEIKNLTIPTLLENLLADYPNAHLFIDEIPFPDNSPDKMYLDISKLGRIRKISKNFGDSDSEKSVNTTPVQPVDLNTKISRYPTDLMTETSPHPTDPTTETSSYPPKDLNPETSPYPKDPNTETSSQAPRDLNTETSPASTDPNTEISPNPEGQRTKTSSQHPKVPNTETSPHPTDPNTETSSHPPKGLNPESSPYLWLAIRPTLIEQVKRKGKASEIIHNWTEEALSAGFEFLPLVENLRNASKLQEMTNTLLQDAQKFKSTASPATQASSTVAGNTPVILPTPSHYPHHHCCYHPSSVDVTSNTSRLSYCSPVTYALKKIFPDPDEPVVILTMHWNDISKVEDDIRYDPIIRERRLTVFNAREEQKNGAREKRIENIRTFLQEPKGLLVTYMDTFGGMQARNVIVLSRGREYVIKNGLLRSTTQLVYIHCNTKKTFKSHADTRRFCEVDEHFADLGQISSRRMCPKLDCNQLKQDTDQDDSCFPLSNASKE